MNIKITDEMIATAEEEAVSLGKLKDSILKGRGNRAGILGELAVATLKSFSHVNTYDYDVVGIDGSTWDVKTKQRTVPALSYYYATVADYNTKQKCDGYIFVSIYESTAQLIGWILKDDFYKKATLYKMGELDPFSDLGWRFRADCYNLPYEELNLVE